MRPSYYESPMRRSDSLTTPDVSRGRGRERAHIPGRRRFEGGKGYTSATKRRVSRFDGSIQRDSMK